MYQKKTEHDFRIKLLSGNNVVLVECPPYDAEIFIPKIINGRIVFENIIGSRRTLEPPMEPIRKAADLTKIQNSPYASRVICSLKREPAGNEKLLRTPPRNEIQNTMPVKLDSVGKGSKTSVVSKSKSEEGSAKKIMPKIAKNDNNFKKPGLQSPAANRKGNYTTDSGKNKQKSKTQEKMLTSARRNLTKESTFKLNYKKKKAAKKN